MIRNYFNYQIKIAKLSNAAWAGTVTSKVDGRVLQIEPAETQGRALFTAKWVAEADMAEIAAAVSRGERF